MRKHNYLVGFVGEKQYVYGEDVCDDQYTTKVSSFTRPMTIWQAVKAIKQLGKGKKTIYKLVPLTSLAVKVLIEIDKKPEPKKENV